MAMRLHLFAGLRVRNFQAARAWYERLLGEPTFFPHAAEAVWTLAEDRSVYVVEHADGAGNCVVTIFVDDLDARVAAIAARGIEPDGRETYSNGVRKVLYRDPDGNEVGFGGAPLEAGSCRPSPTRKPRHATCGPLEPFNRLKQLTRSLPPRHRVGVAVSYRASTTPVFVVARSMRLSDARALPSPNSRRPVPRTSTCCPSPRSSLGLVVGCSRRAVQQHPFASSTAPPRAPA